MLMTHTQAFKLGRVSVPPDEMSVSAMCRQVGEWVVHSSGPKGFSRFPQEAWSKLPKELMWMRTLYAEQYLAKELHLEPSVVVDVQGNSALFLD